MSAKDLKALEHHFYDEWNKGKAALLAVIDETCAINIVFHSGMGGDIRGIKDFKQYMSEFCDALPDIHVTIDDMIVEGDKIAMRYTMTGTHKGEIMGIRHTKHPTEGIQFHPESIMTLVGKRLLRNFLDRAKAYKGENGS